MEPAPAPDRLDELSRLVAELGTRIATLERLAGILPVPATAPAPAAPVPSPEPAARPAVLPVFGRALLGLAGAYMLRALTSAGIVPAWLGVTIGIFYAIAWMASSVRFGEENRLAAGFHIATAVLALAPMLWETTVVFHAINTWVSAALLAGFAVLGLQLSWNRNLGVVAWITTLAGVFTAAALLIATEDLTPFTLALLVIAAAVEFSACRDHWMGERWVVALAADLAILALVRLVTRPAGLPSGYAPVSPGLVFVLPGALLVIYLGSTIVRTLLRALDICVFEAAQVVAAFALFLTAAYWGASGAPAVGLGLGAFALCLGAGCYLVSFTFLDHAVGRDRNLYAYTTFGVALVALGVTLLLKDGWLVGAWCLLGPAAAWFGVRSHRNTLCVHGVIFLLLAALQSGLAIVALEALRATEPLAGAISGGLAATLIALLAGYRLLSPDAASGSRKLPAALLAGLLLFAGIVLAASRLRLLLPATLHPAWGSMILTTLLISAAIAVTWAGRRFDRPELTGLLYPAMAAAAYRFLAHDFRSGRPETLCIVLLFFGAALIVVPKMLRELALPHAPQANRS
ncbi:MAG: hypothetical protein NTY38_08085 [Acidobacteria bacterium]|nr:hypothetical protein [Acidobacteriota bacterium]